MTASGVILASLLPSESGLATSLAIIRRKSQLAKKDFRGRLKAYADVERVEKKCRPLFSHAPGSDTSEARWFSAAA